MKVVVCLLLAVHLTAANLCVENFEDLDISKYIGKWYNNARINHRVGDENSKCLYYDSDVGDKKYTFKRYEVDKGSNKEIEKTGYAQFDVERKASKVYFDGEEENPFEVSLLCLNDEFEISYYGDLSEERIYVYSKQMHLSDELYDKIKEALNGFNIDASKLLPVQVNCPRCTCEGHDHSHDDQLHAHHGQSHDHAHHHHH